MIKNAMGKVAWIARATTTVVALAIMLALVFGMASTAFGANGGNFILGSLNNAATAITRLTGNVNGPAMQVANNNAGTNDTALDLRVQAGEAPMTVNSNEKVANLNADRLDDRDSSAFLPSEIYEKPASGTIAAGSSVGTTAYCDPGDVAVSGSYAVADAGAYLKVSSERRVDDRIDGETGKVNPSGWHVMAQNSDTGAGRSITVYVNCADRPPLHPSP